MSCGKAADGKKMTRLSQRKVCRRANKKWRSAESAAKSSKAPVLFLLALLRRFLTILMTAFFSSLSRCFHQSQVGFTACLEHLESVKDIGHAYLTKLAFQTNSLVCIAHVDDRSTQMLYKHKRPVNVPSEIK